MSHTLRLLGAALLLGLWVLTGGCGDCNPNTDPVAAFTFTPTHGVTTTAFTFDASGSSDRETPTADLQVQWDWEGDAVWDTAWSTTHQVAHTYPVAGTYRPTLAVRDAAGAVALSVGALIVSDGLFAVDSALDSSDPQLLGGEYYELHTFTVPRAANIEVAMSSTPFDAYLILYRGDPALGTPVYVGEDDDGAGHGTDARLVVAATPGRYTLVCTSAWPVETGAYSALAREVPDPASANVLKRAPLKGLRNLDILGRAARAPPALQTLLASPGRGAIHRALAPLHPVTFPAPTTT